MRRVVLERDTLMEFRKIGGVGGNLSEYVIDAIANAVVKKMQAPCEDCISRQAVLETIDDCNSDGLKGIFCSYDDGERFKEYIKKLPSVTPTRKKGKWEQK